MCSLAGHQRRPLGRVLVSLSRCIYENLAFEELLLRTHDIDRHGDVLLVWSNRPAVVIGRHQNPWVEANLPLLASRGVDIARRHSGGGTVYHDEGNINVSFLTSQKDHCRKRNLEHIADHLNQRFQLNVVATARDDLELLPGSRKCSGTAARIARDRAYHHLSMLVFVDLALLSATLRSPISASIKSTSTPSTRAPAVGFLQEDDKEANVESVRENLIDSFVDRYEMCERESVNVSEFVAEREAGAAALAELRSWEWIFGRTPPFEVNPDQPAKRLFVEKGRIQEVGVAVGSELLGRKFSEQVLVA